MPHASRKIKFFSVTFDDFKTHYKNYTVFQEFRVTAHRNYFAGEP